MVWWCDCQAKILSFQHSIIMRKPVFRGFSPYITQTGCVKLWTQVMNSMYKYGIILNLKGIGKTELMDRSICMFCSHIWQSRFPTTLDLSRQDKCH